MKICLAKGYYRIRCFLGFPEILPERRERQEILHPETDPASALREEDEGRIRLCAGILAAGLLLAVAAGLAGTEKRVEHLVRPEAGEDAREILLEGRLGGEPFEIPLRLESRKYSLREWEELKAAVWQELLQKALGENPDWEHISHDLILATETGVPGITVSWESTSPERIREDGTLGEKTEEADGETVILTAVIQWEDETFEQQVMARLSLPPVTPGDELEKNLEAYLAEAASDREKPVITLPGEYRGRALEFLKRTGTPPSLFVFLAITAVLAAWFLPEQRKKEEEKHRKESLEKAYPELISSLTVLMGAGLPVRAAWERMVLHYRASLAAGGEKQVLYEEMSLALNSLGQGVLEEEMYVRFGRRCGLQPYLRLGSLLQSNLKRGSRGLLPLMKEEAEAALEERLREARKHGEEISSRLLVPMILLFSLVMTVLMAPAILSF